MRLRIGRNQRRIQSICTSLVNLTVLSAASRKSDDLRIWSERQQIRKLFAFDIAYPELREASVLRFQKPTVESTMKRNDRLLTR